MWHHHRDIWAWIRNFRETKRGLQKSKSKIPQKMGERNLRLEFLRRMAKSKTKSRNKKEAKVS